MKDFYKQSTEDILKYFNSDHQKGLTTESIEDNSSKYGKNIIQTKKKKGIFSIFIEQLMNPIVILLIIVAILSGFSGEIIETVLITGIIVFMAIIGTVLENNAGNAVEKLKQIGKTYNNVIRGGKILRIDSEEIVCGDIIAISEGDQIPADSRILETNSFKSNEAILTGESLPVDKSNQIITRNCLIAEQKNMVFKGTYALEGSAKVIVVKVGIDTEIGNIAQKLAEIETSETPLQIQLNKLSQILVWGTIIVSSIISILSILRGTTILDALIQSLALAIAFIPEGLSAVMTVTLALGVKEMVKKNVIIKRLIAAEGLGAVSVLATDKTGTITTGKMSVDKIWMYNRFIDIKKLTATSKAENKLINILKFCNNSKGATEIALINFLEEIDIEFELEERFMEHRFSSDVKRMTVVKKYEDEYHSFSKGAPDVLIPLCSEFIDYQTDEHKKLDEAKMSEILDMVDTLAKEGFRVLCLAHKESSVSPTGERDKDEIGLVFVSLIALMDPIRPEVSDTVTKLKLAGIKPVIITGDHPEIARTIGLTAGILTSYIQRVITGMELEEYFKGNASKLSLADILECSVFARVTPNHKNDLIKLYKDNGVIVAMVGDGVNDSVAISQASIGIAVDKGSDIVKEVADVIITGTYDTLINAIETGRTIIYRSRLYLHYILSGNACEVGVFLLVIGLTNGSVLPLTAISLLIINLLTDAAPAMAMAVEKADPNILLDKPRKQGEMIINKEIWMSILLQSIISSAYLFAIYLYFLPFGTEFVQTAVFSGYVFQKLFRAYTARSLRESVFKIGVFSNKYINISVLFALLVWYLTVYVAEDIFEFAKIDINSLVIIFVPSLIMPVFEELYKLYKRRFN